jgi:hypothetical protein
MASCLLRVYLQSVVYNSNAHFLRVFYMKRPQRDANQLENLIVSSICIGFSPLP